MRKNNPFNEKLPILEAIVNNFLKDKKINLNEIAFVCVQHLLFTTYHLFEALVAMGANVKNIHILGKLYSSCPAVEKRLLEGKYHFHKNIPQKKHGYFSEYFQSDINRMWQSVYLDLTGKNIKLIVVLDDGGHCLAGVPDFILEKYPLVGVEQTTFGITNLKMHHLPFPVIEVASSAVKQLIESPMIAEAVVKKAEKFLPLNQSNLLCSVIGLGVIGQAIAKKLIELKHKVIIFDRIIERNKKIPGAYLAENIEEALYDADYIFGCAGNDITEFFDHELTKRDKFFISCSSQDKEFSSLLRLIQSKTHEMPLDILDDLNYQTKLGATITILRGGFPINLDHSGESVAATDIQVTRSLLLGGILQAISCFSQGNLERKNIRYMLHPALQRFVVVKWLSYGSVNLFDPHFLMQFNDVRWIKDFSGGNYEENDYIDHFFNFCYYSAI